MNPGLTLALVLITGLLCIFIGVRLGRRQMPNENDRLAWSAFRVWWFAMGVSTLLGPLNGLFASANIDTLAVYIVLGLFSTLAICIALWGLLFYLIYLFTGSRKWALPLGIFYIAFFVGFVLYSLLVLRPIGVDVAGGVATLRNANAASPLAGLVTLLLVVAPQLLAGIAYLSIYFRLRERASKLRVLMVSIPLIVWFGSPLLALILGAGSTQWWVVVSRLIPPLAVLVIYWAYYPPLFLQSRLGATGIE